METSSTLLSSQPSSQRGICLMFGSVVVFTLNTLLLKWLMQGHAGISPDIPLLFRAAIGIGLVLTCIRGRRPTQWKPIFTNRSLILRGVTGLLGTAAFYWTLPALGAGKATLICNTYAVFAPVIAGFFLKETLRPITLIWFTLAFAGIFLLVRTDDDIEFSLGFYDWIALGGAIMAASSVVLVRSLIKEFSGGTIYLSQCVWILIPMLIMAGPKLMSLTFTEAAFLFIAGAAAGGGQLLMNEGYRSLTVSSGASIQMLWPLLTTLGGCLLFDERFLPLQLVGAALILLSVWRVSIAR